MTPEQKTEHLKGTGVCPYCHSDDITGGGVQIEGNKAIQEVTCNSCYSTWEDRYQLVAVLGPTLNPGDKNHVAK